MARKGLARRLHQRATRARLDLTATLLEQLTAYVELLQRWNERMNLTALDDRDTGLDRLVIEPLVAARHLPSLAARVIDVGSGGGSPAIPLRLAMQGGSMLMVETKTRKAAFLREAIRQLGLEETRVEPGRFESLLAVPDLHEAFDVLTLRAVRVEGRVLRGVQAFLRPGGALFLFRAGRDEPAGIEPPLRWRATYPLVDSLRSRLVVVEKDRALANK